MKYVLTVSKGHQKLAIAEALSLIAPAQSKVDNHLLLIDTKRNSKSWQNRLAYTKQINTLLFTCSEKNITQYTQKYDWAKIYQKSFSLNAINATAKEKQLAQIIWNKIKDKTKRRPNVDLKNAKTKIEFIFHNKKVYASLLIHKNSEPFEKRKPHKKVVLQPISLDPRLARSMVNLLGKDAKTIIDPFCGTGGLLVEAGLMNLKIRGSDINPWMLNACEKNLKQHKLKATIKQQDATKITHANYIVTDPPYSKNTKDINTKKLYQDFLINIKRIKTKRAVISFPDFIKYKPMIKQAKLKIIQEFEYYIHKSLTKKIVVVE